jgi:acyl CoA:acetate/3-ketoacid CoA transferase
MFCFSGSFGVRKPNAFLRILEKDFLEIRVPHLTLLFACRQSGEKDEDFNALGHDGLEACDRLSLEVDSKSQTDRS